MRPERIETKELAQQLKSVVLDLNYEGYRTHSELVSQAATRLLELEKDRERLRRALKACIGWTYRAKDLEVSGSMQMAQLNDIEEALATMEETK